MRSIVTAAVLFALAAHLTAGEKGWPQFRGPRGDGSSLAEGVPITWSETNGLAWKVGLPGRGRSSPVIAANRVWLTLAVEQGVVRQRIEGDDMQTAEHVSLEVVCLDANDGKILWHTKLFDVKNPDPVHWFNGWATPTPAIAAGKLYCDFGTFGTACLDAGNGQEIWRTRLPLDHQVGPGSSVVLHQNLMILVRDGRDAQYVTALDQQTGKPVWRTERPPMDTANGNLKKSFVTPLLVQAAGHTQLIAPGAHWVVSYDPLTGKEFWRANHGKGFSIGSCPVFGDGVVYFSTGCMKPQLWAIRADGSGEVTTSHALWKTLRQVPVMSSPLLQGDTLYWTSDDGMANCSSTKDGEAFWQERLRQQHLASPLLAEGRVYFFGKEGKITVVKADKKFAPLAENQLDGTIIATPAIVDGAIYYRTDTHLYRIGKK